jgi:hypothetical protein
VRSIVQGEFARAGSEFFVTEGGMKLHSRVARLMASKIDRGPSVANDITGTEGSLSTAAWVRMKRMGTMPEYMKDGFWPRNGAVDMGLV